VKPQTQGAWIIHHTKKLQNVTNPSAFDQIHTAGKCGILLSALAESDGDSTISSAKVKVIANAAKITSLELPSILSALDDQFLIDRSKAGDVTVLGLTTSTVLSHTADIFSTTLPSPYERAALALSEAVSDEPQTEKLLKEFVSDSYKLSSTQVGELVRQAEEIGFVDSENHNDGSDKVYFNGNLFRKENIKKAENVLSTLKPEERTQYRNLDAALGEKGCLTLPDAIKLSSDTLIQKLASIGMIDLNQVANDHESKIFITKPAAFSKFGSPFEEDALDLAKAFVASLTYGIVYSGHSRGRINDLGALIRKLLRGLEIGPTTSIGQDYKVLELNRVVELRSSKEHPGRYFMRLLKKDIGHLALKVLETGDAASEESILTFQSSSVNQFYGPEFNREEIRKRKIATESKTQILEALNSLRLSQ